MKLEPKMAQLKVAKMKIPFFSDDIYLRKGEYGGELVLYKTQQVGR